MAVPFPSTPLSREGIGSPAARWDSAVFGFLTPGRFRKYFSMAEQGVE